jgi:hypothetical protein
MLVFFVLFCFVLFCFVLFIIIIIIIIILYLGTTDKTTKAYYYYYYYSSYIHKIRMFTRSRIESSAAFDRPTRAARHGELLDDARVDRRRDRWQRVRRHVRIDVCSLQVVVRLEVLHNQIAISVVVVVVVVATIKTRPLKKENQTY